MIGKRALFGSGLEKKLKIKRKRGEGGVWQVLTIIIWYLL